ELVKSSDTTLKTLDSFLARFDKGSNAPSVVSTNQRPFDIRDYAMTAKEATALVKELNETLQTIDKATPQLQKAGENFENAGNRLLNRLLWIGAGLIAFLLAGTVIAALVYRRLARADRGTPMPQRVD